MPSCACFIDYNVHTCARDEQEVKSDEIIISERKIETKKNRKKRKEKKTLYSRWKN